jgi:hypothetical protein
MAMKSLRPIMVTVLMLLGILALLTYIPWPHVVPMRQISAIKNAADLFQAYAFFTAWRYIYLDIRAWRLPHVTPAVSPAMRSWRMPRLALVPVLLLTLSVGTLVVIISLLHDSEGLGPNETMLTHVDVFFLSVLFYSCSSLIYVGLRSIIRGLALGKIALRYQGESA